MLIVSGEVDDEIDTEKCKDWADYWRILFKKVSVSDIREFEEKYQGKKNKAGFTKKAPESYLTYPFFKTLKRVTLYFKH